MQSNADSLISVQKVPHQYNPHWVFKKNDNNNLEIATGEKTNYSKKTRIT